MKPKSGIVKPPGTVRSSTSKILDELHLPPHTAAIQSSTPFTEMRVTYYLPIFPLALTYVLQEALPREVVSARHPGRAQQLVLSTAILDFSWPAEVGTVLHQMD